MPRNTITLTQAQDWANRWNQNKVTYLTNNDLKAFKIPKDVIDDVTQPRDVVDVRTYFGLDVNSDPHLMIVGVDNDGNDLIDEQNGFYIYNFATPCPSYCNQTDPFINS